MNVYLVLLTNVSDIIYVTMFVIRIPAAPKIKTFQDVLLKRIGGVIEIMLLLTVTKLFLAITTKMFKIWATNASLSI